ncbi:MAG: hypothetical protein A3B11_00020 [Candidatus Taylorbacteria bacterium RIFCSPLOWO2_01_FULL_44_26]|uniref:DoxX family protein n=2 Tax=Candidatus Tayloriibacteriota TaxID=1817919 RepID=A0A1G2MKS7_9BACT|nr:MAG: hypothetical protein A3D50_01660 [Candidatus Taylorbacteria bacterium RIFCSPHIGHO2_02_FULL_44_12]OHA31081.1 MAG: hypothetical protein A3B11_00020 [Candidatus Taylorbacteria bacterium RIFCSPLOWO2_01_FULL_44_26]
MNRDRTLYILARLAIAFSFVYVGWSMFTSPDLWIGYTPEFIEKAFKAWGWTNDLVMKGEAIIHIVLGLWILSGKNIFLPSLLATLFLASIVFFNQTQFPILFRDVSLALVALGLTVYSREH